jgi:hypothetical protein
MTRIAGLILSLIGLVIVYQYSLLNSIFEYNTDQSFDSLLKSSNEKFENIKIAFALQVFLLVIAGLIMFFDDTDKQINKIKKSIEELSKKD